jgi:hypothetical protein
MPEAEKLHGRVTTEEEDFDCHTGTPCMSFDSSIKV